MFRRRRGPKKQVFSRQLSFAAGAVVTGGSSPASYAFEQPLLNYQQLLHTAAIASATPEYANLVKGISLKSISWTSDYAFTGGAGVPTTTVFGAEALYIDRAVNAGSMGSTLVSSQVQENGYSPFMDIPQTTSEWIPGQFPERTLHRRRFTTILTVGNGYGATYWTPGFGTERHIRRPATLKPNQALFWRFEAYDVDIGADNSALLDGDLLGVVSFAILV